MRQEVPREEWARRLLEDQLARLDELRNANPRDSGFKLWRQTALTVIQRIWPADLAKSERFRRVPFTTPSAKASRAQIKECFERGCAEATTFLKDLILEVETGGVGIASPAGGPEPKPAALGEAHLPTRELADAERDPFEPSLLDMIRPGVEAPATEKPVAGELVVEKAVVERPAAVKPAVGRAVVGKPPAKAIPPVPAAPASPPPAAPPPPQGAAITPPTRPALAQTKPPAPSAKPPRRNDRRALKEMLGFVEAPGRSPVPEASAPPPPPAPVPPPEDAFEPPRPAPSFAAGDYDQVEFRAAPESAGEPTVEEPADEAPYRGGKDFAIDFLSKSPALSAQPKPPPASRPATATERSPAATALMAIAGEIAALGVAEGQRAATRATLLDLAREIDQHAVRWDSLRGLIQFAMDHPPLARRLIPLLIPYLDLER